MYGIGPGHIHSLCVGEMGIGITPKQVSEMTIDTILFLLADKKILRKSKKRRSMTGAVPIADEDGNIKGRTKDGKPIQGRIAGKSVARQLMEQEAEKRKLKPEPGWKRRQRKRLERRQKKGV